MLDWITANWLWLAFGGLFVWMHTGGHGCGGHGHSDDGHGTHREPYPHSDDSAPNPGGTPTLPQAPDATRDALADPRRPAHEDTTDTASGSVASSVSASQPVEGMEGPAADRS